MHTIRAYNDVSGVYRAVLCMDRGTVFVDIHARDALPCQHPILVFELVEEDLKQRLAIDKYLRIADPIHDGLVPHSIVLL